jgi:hypothetical protein
MRRVWALALIAGASGGAAFADCDMPGMVITGFSDAQWSNIAGALEFQPDELRSAAGLVSGVLVDLNIDGEPEICVTYDTSLTCSNGVAVCAHAVLSGVDFAEVVYENAGHRLRVASTPAPEWAALSMESTHSDGSTSLAISVYQDGIYMDAGAIKIGQR